LQSNSTPKGVTTSSDKSEATPTQYTSMKILHTADWHLGKRLEWLPRHEEQKVVLEEICDIADRENVDAILIAGDLFDTYNPPNESIDLFYRICKKLTNNGLRAVVAIAGNHDSPERVEAPDPLARECGIIFAGFPNSRVQPFSLPTGLAVTQSDEGFIELKLPNCAYPLRILHTSYANETRLRQYLGIDNTDKVLRNILGDKWANTAENYANTEGVNLLMAHLFVMQKDGTAPEEPDDEKPINIGGASAIFTENFPLPIQYVALGHLHRQQVVDKKNYPIIYSGSPLAYSFAEENQDKYVMLLHAKPAQAIDYERLKLNTPKKLVRERFDSIEEAVTWLNLHLDDIVEITIVSDTHIKSEDRRRLLDTHKAIIHIKPELKSDKSADENAPKIDLNKSINELFLDYFKYKKGQEPNEELLNIFKELLSE
jgi:DNA repair protein SbcD/Mre11